MDNKEITIRLLEAFFAHNTLKPPEALQLIEDMHKKVQEIFDEQYQSSGLLSCKICGQQMKRLRRHLRAKHDLSVEEYCKNTGLKIEDIKL